MKRILSLLFSLAITPALAQWQVPTGNYPIGRGTGTGFNSVPGSGILTNTIQAKTANYTLVSSDCGSTISLGGTAFYTLTVNAASGYPATCRILVTNTDTGRGKKMAVNGITVGHSNILWPVQSFTLANVNNTWTVIGLPQRWELSANISLFVDVTNGSNGNDGLASGSGNAWQTIQKAIDIVIDEIDLSAQSITINVAAGNYPENISLGNYIGAHSSKGFKQVLVKATDATCANTKINPTSGIAIFATGNNQPFTFEGFQLESPGNNVILVEADSGGFVALKAICFGAVASPGSHMVTIFLGSRIAIIESNYSVVGGGNIHEDAQFGGTIYHQAGLTATITGTPTFNIWARATNGGSIYTNTTTYSGSANGQRYSAFNNGIIDTGNNNALPGSTAGTVLSGGLYNGTLNANQQGIANHPVSTSLGTPAASTCGTGPGTNGTDAAGFVTTGTGATACTITFVQAWVNAPQCIVQRLNSASALTYSTSTTAITISAASASASYQWICIGFPGG